MTVSVRCERGSLFVEKTLYIQRQDARASSLSKIGTALQREVYEALRMASAELETLSKGGS